MPAENPDVAGNERESALCPKKRKSGRNRQLTLHEHQDAPAQRATSIPGVLQTPSSSDLSFAASAPVPVRRLREQSFPASAGPDFHAEQATTVARLLRGQSPVKPLGLPLSRVFVHRDGGGEVYNHDATDTT